MAKSGSAVGRVAAVRVAAVRVAAAAAVAFREIVRWEQGRKKIKPELIAVFTSEQSSLVARGDQLEEEEQIATR